MKQAVAITLLVVLIGGFLPSQAQKALRKGSPGDEANRQTHEKARQEVLRQTNVQDLNRLSSEWKERAKEERALAHQKALENGWPIRFEDESGNVIELIRLDETGYPEYYTTDNLNAAKSISTNEVWAGGSAGTNLGGSGMTIGVWDGGGVRLSHQEFAGSATQMDGASSLSDHATHVAGTMVAWGNFDSTAKGMAYLANIDCYDWSSDESEMAAAAASGLLVSNHSYGSVTGWAFGSWSGGGNQMHWWGNPSISPVEDYRFGFYSSSTRDWDLIAQNAPYYLIVKSAGNDRNDEHNGSHQVFISGGGGWTSSTDPRDEDGGIDGYDCIPQKGNAKNILTIGAVSDIPGGYSSPFDVNMSSFSGWGPTDDGRIKPDIVGNGISLYSTSSSGDAGYTTKSGTSMSAPNVSGSLLLLQEHYFNTNTAYMKSATLKALTLHTADEAGAHEGPDYQHGWGMMNTETAVNHISSAGTSSGEDLILEETLANGNTYTFQRIYSDGNSPIRATLAWTDPASSANPASLNPTTSKLVNDLDLRIIGNSSHLPYILDPANPNNAATTGDNVRDNVEQVYLANPAAGFYTIQVSHKGTLSSSQDFSLVVSASDTMLSLTVTQAISCGDTLTGTTASGSNHFDFYNCASWVETGPEHIYSLTLSNSEVVTASLFDLNADLDLFLLSDHFNCLAYGDSSLSYNLDPGTYYFVIDGYQGVSGSYSLRVDCGLPTCNTIPIACGDSVNGTTVGSASIIDQYNCVSWNESGPEVAYELTLASSSDITASLANLSADLDVFLISSCDTASVSCLAYGDNQLTYQSAAPGTYYVIVDGYLGASGSYSLTVEAAPIVSFPAISPICADASPVQLSASPVGGNYLGQGAVGTQFDPALVGAGTHPITYAYSDLNGCSNNVTASIIVNPLPAVSLAPVAALCEDASPIQLLVSPTGGSFSGAGVSGGMFDPSTVGPGIHPVTYTITDVNGCVNSDSIMITVNAAPLVSLIPISDVCINDAPVQLSTSVPGGTWCSPGIWITGNMFDPILTGPGTHLICYSITDANGCFASDTISVVVHPLPAVSVSPVSSICLNEPPVQLSGSPSTGVYSGIGINGELFEPLVAGTGMHEIYYTVTDMNGCVNSDSTIITVNAIPTVSVSPVAALCLDAAPVQLSGTPMGGMYTGSGINADQFDPTVAGVGSTQINYVFTDANGCTNTDSTSITVYPLPEVSLSVIEALCLDASPVQVTGSPSGGTYMGSGINGDQFDPFVAGAGSHQIDYSFTDLNGCSETASGNIMVNALPPKPSVDQTGNLLSTASPATTYRWYLNGTVLPDSTSQMISPSDSGFYQVEVIDANNCSSISDSLFFRSTGVGIEELFPSASFSLYPNPSDGMVFLSVENLPIHSGLAISVHDMRGRRILQEEWQEHGNFVKSLNLSKEARGLYLIRISHSGKTVFGKKLMLR